MSDFNQAVAAAASREAGCLFQQAQFLRAIHQGSIAILKDEVRTAVVEAYQATGLANTVIEAAWYQSLGQMAPIQSEAKKRAKEAESKIKDAKTQLLRFLGSGT